jgi:REP element-mobilizing transposase RayT
MVLGYHCIFGFYGFWLPNDPRGSGSNYVARWELLRYGPATKTLGRRSVAHRPHDQSRRIAAKSALRYPAVEITGRQAVTVVSGFCKAAQEGQYSIHACAVMPNHVHLVIGRHGRPIRKIVGHMKARATRMLKERRQWHEDDRPVWSEHGWNVFLNDRPAVEHAIRYVEENPVKESKKRQR